MEKTENGSFSKNHRNTREIEIINRQCFQGDRRINIFFVRRKNWHILSRNKKNYASWRISFPKMNVKVGHYSWNSYFHAFSRWLLSTCYLRWDNSVSFFFYLKMVKIRTILQVRPAKISRWWIIRIWRIYGCW